MTELIATGYDKLVLFDIDGTLLFTHGAGRRAITQALIDELGTSGPIDSMRFDGKTDPQIVQELMDGAEHPRRGDDAAVQAVCERYANLLEHELAHASVGVEVLPGVREILDALHAHEETLLGLLTGNLERGAQLKLRACGIDTSIFRVGAFGSDHAVRSSLPAIAAARARSLMGREPGGHDVVIVGDTPADVTCGAAIGARAVAVATGSYSAQELRDAGAFAVFDDLSDTGHVMQAIFD